MATYVNNLRLKEIATGAESGTWGTSTNTNLELITDAMGYGVKAMAADANETFTMADGSADTLRSMFIKITSGVSLTSARTVTFAPNTLSKLWWVENSTSGGQSIIIKQGSGAEVTIPTGTTKILYTDGGNATAAVTDALTNVDVGDGTVTSVAVSGGTTGLTTSGGPITGSGTITVAGTLAVANGGTGITALGTGVATAIAVNVGSAGAFTTFNGALGTPSSGTATNLTGLPAAGVSGTAAILGANTFTGEQFFVETKDTVYTITDGAGFAIDPVNGNIQVVTLGAARSPTATNFVAGQAILMGVDDGATYAITWPSVTWLKSGGTGVAPDLATTGYTWVMLFKQGSTLFGTIVGSP